ncbi:MAG: PIG-L family deacetylase [Opitutaceae bacterium]
MRPLPALLLPLVAAGVVAGGEPAPGAALRQQLASLATTGTLLHIAAHPDDENTHLITYFARARGYRTGYLSLTRGDGGQNEIGPEFDAKLGVARTQELLEARKLDGGVQFFTRAIDFGYSKSAEETLRFWDRREVLGDVVRVIRQFRPDVIVTRFSPRGGGTHGHHTASGILGVEAFQLAADPAAYPEQLAEGLRPWQARRVVLNSGGSGRGGGGEGALRLDIGGADPATGEGLGTIAGRSRARHITQGFGSFGARGGGAGPNEQSFTLLGGEPATRDLFDGVDVTWGRYGPAGVELAAAIEAVRREFRPEAPAASVPALFALRRRLEALPADALIADRRRQLEGIIQECLGLRARATAERAEVVPGAALRWTLEVSTAATSVRLRGVRLGEREWPDAQGELAPGGVWRFQTEARVPADQPLTHPYWLREEGAAGLFAVADRSLIGRAEDPPAFSWTFVVEVGGEAWSVVVPGEAAESGERAGRRRGVAVVAPVVFQLAHEVELFAPGATREVKVQLTREGAPLSGRLLAEAGAGWKAEVPAPEFSAGSGAPATVVVRVTAPAAGGGARLRLLAEVDGRRYAGQRAEIRYPHLAPQVLQPPAEVRLVALDVRMGARQVGYLPGAGDDLERALVQLGCTVRRLQGKDLSPGGLAGLDAVVIGVRAFNERDDLAANLPGLFAWVEQGGTVVAQYNRPNGLAAPNLGPHALSIQGPAPQLRVTDERAPVSFLLPAHPVLNVPNRIGPEDFAGWVQERGAYFPSSWDETRWAAVLALADPGEAPLRSGLLVAKHGRGRYVYTGLAFFRQLPAGVPGAYRLLANLLSPAP